MPTLNLRLTDEQHEKLVERARRGMRSLQRQIVYELFYENEEATDAEGDRETDGPAARRAG